MFSYSEFIKKMNDRGFIYKNNSPISLNGSGDLIKTYSLEKNKTGKIVEIACPKNTIMSLCGEDMGCCDKYVCSLKCFDNEGNEPFNEHKCYPLYIDPKSNMTKGSVIDIVVTKVVKDEKTKNFSRANDYPMLATIMNIIKSNNLLEYPMLVGSYQKVPEYLVKNSFNLYPNEKLILYAIDPDIVITKIDFKIDIDIFEKIMQ